MNRRQFLQQSTAALGAAACAPLLPPSLTVPWDWNFNWGIIEPCQYRTIRLDPSWITEAADYPIVYAKD